MQSVSWILHQTSHSGNVGSAARAIKTMGFDQLILVDPKNPEAIHAPDAVALASGADDVLAKTQVINCLDEATNSRQLVFGLSARDREFGPPSISIKEACAIAKDQSCAFLFGTERTGLRNEDYQYCTHRVWIDANPAYSSLNLAQAVMVCAYEMRQSLQDTHQLNRSGEVPRANIEAINALMEHLREGLIAIDFLNPSHPKKLMERLRSLFDRAGLYPEEVDLLRGVAKQMILKQDKGFKL
jgi:tRNA/rRNA methyltransferase